jgi:hypothetical protein
LPEVKQSLCPLCDRIAQFEHHDISRMRYYQCPSCQDKRDDFWPNILNQCGAMESERSRNIALHAGHADTHVARIAPPLQKWSKDSDKDSSRDNPQREAKKFLTVVMDYPPFLKSGFGSYATRNR